MTARDAEAAAADPERSQDHSEITGSGDDRVANRRQRPQGSRTSDGRHRCRGRADADEQWRGQSESCYNTTMEETHKGADGQHEEEGWRSSWRESNSSWWSSHHRWDDSAWQENGGNGWHGVSSSWHSTRSGHNNCAAGCLKGAGGRRGRGNRRGKTCKGESVSDEHVSQAGASQPCSDYNGPVEEASEDISSVIGGTATELVARKQQRQRKDCREGKGRRRGSGRVTHDQHSSIARVEMGTLTEQLADELGKGIYDCMICISRVARGAPIWSCNKCWAAFHLKCIHQWVKKTSGDASCQEHSWPCPGCRYFHVGPMPEYTCYCGKIRQPDCSPHWLAHSCGEVCERSRGCEHACPELCHPGPCPPCTATGQLGQCHCGREKRQTSRCWEPTRWSCGEPCGQLLACGKHSCSAKCHSGPCPPCAVSSVQRCYCELTEERRMCGHEEFACDKTCGRQLACGKHKCERPCHPGDCGHCALEPSAWGDRCACGKTRRCESEAAAATLVRWVGRRTKCSDPIPLCGQLCGKSRVGCSHLCQRPCHEGPCGPCGKTVSRTCRCGRTTREVECGGSSDPIICTHVCRNMMTCQNHRCDAVCCEGYGSRHHEVHMCLQVCGRELACGSHFCESFCHLGRCAPCGVVLREPLMCACGASTIDPPVRCGTLPPHCDQPCGQELPCGHICPANCHFGDHPLCCELVSRTCLGGHREMHNQPCHVGTRSCGQPCSKKLSCGHKCSAQCHAGECPPCTRPCGARRVHCEHVCEMPCHPQSECEDVPCRRKVRLTCPCGLRLEEQPCGAHSGLPRPQLPALRCGSSCERPAAAIRCLEKAVAAAAASADAGEPEKYTADIQQWAVRHLQYVETLEDKFAMTMGGGVPAGGPTPPRATAASAVVMPPCDLARRLLAVEYARLHWHLRTNCKPDAADGWWIMRVESTAAARAPRPLLSQAAASKGFRGLVLGVQPRLRFVGSRGGGDELYDLAGRDGLLGMRPGQKDGEVVAFFDRGTAAATAFRRLAGANATLDGELVPVRGFMSGGARPGAGSSAWGGAGASVVSAAPGPQGLRVALEQPLVGRCVTGGADGNQAAGHQTAAGGSTRPVPPTETTARSPAPSKEVGEPLPDSWEDALD